MSLCGGSSWGPKDVGLAPFFRPRTETGDLVGMVAFGIGQRVNARSTVDFAPSGHGRVDLQPLCVLFYAETNDSWSVLGHFPHESEMFDGEDLKLPLGGDVELPA